MAEYLLRRVHDGHYFCRPFGTDHQEWSTDPKRAHIWLLEESAIAGARAFRLIHNIELEVVDRDQATQEP